MKTGAVAPQKLSAGTRSTARRTGDHLAVRAPAAADAPTPSTHQPNTERYGEMSYGTGGHGPMVVGPSRRVALTETAAVRCARYVEENHFLGAEVNSFRRIVLRAGPVRRADGVDTIQVPRPLGDQVQADLLSRGLATPTIENRGTGNLIFLTRSARPGDSRSIHISSKLFSLQAISTVKGSIVTLPGPRDRHRLLWLEEPVGPDRPDFETVVDIVLEAAQRLSKAG
ncbi:hypothetical protein [Nocardia nova]|uniref:hypothetical protein n=1 Tax=Nocardia nova TaxID=37330 RepID=UPI0033D372C0